MKNKIIILGCGYLGFNLAVDLAKNNEILVLGLENNYTKLLPKSLKFININLSNADKLDDVDFTEAIVINAIGGANSLNNIENFSKELKNIEMVTSIIVKLNKKEIKMFIQLSSGGTVYGDPKNQPIVESTPCNPVNIYGLSKMCIESFLKVNSIENGLKFNIVRLGNPYGGYQDPNKNQGIIPIIIRKTLSNLPLTLWTTPENTRDYIYITDFIEGIKAIIESNSNSEIYNLGTGVGTQIIEIVNIVEKEIGDKLKIESKSIDPKNIESNILNIEKINNLGFECNFSLVEGIKLEVERIRKETITRGN